MAERPILVTGVSGFAGWHVARALAARATVVGTFHTRPIEIAGVRAVSVDLSNAAEAAALIRSTAPRAVVHAAALTDPNDCERRPEAATLANEIATENLAAALDAHAPDASLVLFSTDLVYPGDRAWSRESDPTGPLMHYGRTKLAAERAVAARRGPWIVLRCALLYGPPAPLKSGATGWMRERIERGEPLTLFTDEYRTPVHVSDVIEAVALCAEPASPAANRILNLGGGERLTRFAMGEALARALGRPSEVLVPALLADSTFPAPRPADVSMDTSELRALLGRGLLSFQGGVERSLAPLS